jgi:hypothetical protein
MVSVPSTSKSRIFFAVIFVLVARALAVVVGLVCGCPRGGSGGSGLRLWGGLSFILNRLSRETETLVLIIVTEARRDVTQTIPERRGSHRKGSGSTGAYAPRREE